MDIRELKLADLQPTQFYVSEKKLQEAESWFSPADLSAFDPIPVAQGGPAGPGPGRAGLGNVPTVRCGVPPTGRPLSGRSAFPDRSRGGIPRKMGPVVR